MGHPFPSQILQLPFPQACSTDTPGPCPPPGNSFPRFRRRLPGALPAWEGCRRQDFEMQLSWLIGQASPPFLQPTVIVLNGCSSWFHGILFTHGWDETPSGRGMGPGTAVTNTSKPKSKCKDFLFSTHHRVNSGLTYLDLSCDYTTFTSSTSVTSPEDDREIFLSCRTRFWGKRL